MSPHVYFLIDTNAFSNTHNPLAITSTVTRILVYLASKHDTLTWNYELLDTTTTRNRTTAQTRRKTGERKQLTIEALGQFKDHLRNTLAVRRAAGARARAPLDSLHERLMCLEADVEWGDPAMMRSPRRSAMQGMDPTRANDPLSVRSHLYIISDSPWSLETLDLFIGTLHPATVPAVAAAADTTNADASLMEKLTRMRNGLVGNGIWESYARKRVGINWIRPQGRTIPGMDPVEILIDSVFACCLEALGGCVMSVDELSTPGALFSSRFAPLHRVRTYPSWNRKFAAEISAVAEHFAIPNATVESELHGDTHIWRIHCPQQQQQQQEGVFAGFGGEGVVLKRVQGWQQRQRQNRRWLVDGRIMQKYDLPEMVALAAEYKRTLEQQQWEDDLHWSGEKHKILLPLLCVPLCMWPVVVRMTVGGAPAMFEITGGSGGGEHWANDGVFAQSFVVAQAGEGGFSGAAYVAMVPVGGRTVAIYEMEACAYAEVARMSAHGESAQGNASNGGDSEEDLFSLAWIEDWAWKVPGGLAIEPRESCAINVSFEYPQHEAGFPGLSSSTLSASCAALPECSMDTGDCNAMHDAGEQTALCDSVPVSTLEAWYVGVYLKVIRQPISKFDHALDSLGALLDSSPAEIAHDGSSGEVPSMLNILRESVLLSSSAVEDAFDNIDQDLNEESTAFSDVYLASRLHRVSAMVGEDTGAQRMWQLSECQLQILLHLFVIDRMHTDSNNGCAEQIEQLSNSLRDLVDLMCIWVSMGDLDGISGVSPGSIAAAVALLGDGAECPSDLAAAFVSGPLVGRFATSLGDLVEELRVQCGWVPQTIDSGSDVAELGDLEGGCTGSDDILGEGGRRRKGTPRKISRSSGDRSEVIVHQRHQTATSGNSGRKLARHLDELISGGSSSSSGGGSSSKAHCDSNPRSRLTLSNRAVLGDSRQQNQKLAHLKMPAHLIRQLKSEVVSTARSAAKPRQATSTTKPAAVDSSGGNIWGVGRSNTLRRRVQRRFPESNSSPLLGYHAREARRVPEEEDMLSNNKRQRIGERSHAGGVGAGSSLSAVFPRSSSTAHVGFFCDRVSINSGGAYVESQHISGAVGVSEMHGVFSHEMFEVSSDDEDGGIYIYDHRAAQI
ncbi:hypothetical protein LPJ66_005848 [Kickxella alabastrina]|uniref:Uncharacterized protein n=1 Tax=Kickxella alabastrina TaxID=61397 RepID=A0ACC1IES1_9FUNG|nr:hypothetical protein LPJ66_005848 [Kickxella alabastrina]